MTFVHMTLGAAMPGGAPERVKLAGPGHFITPPVSGEQCGVSEAIAGSAVKPSRAQQMRYRKGRPTSFRRDPLVRLGGFDEKQVRAGATLFGEGPRGTHSVACGVLARKERA